ncbi:MAG: hypothetical protein JW705_08485 [Methanosarcinaceae archaeon]|nr:hypothetical protein [Methanosarcinaceae archaeon]
MNDEKDRLPECPESGIDTADPDNGVSVPSGGGDITDQHVPVFHADGYECREDGLIICTGPMEKPARTDPERTDDIIVPEMPVNEEVLPDTGIPEYKNDELDDGCSAVRDKAGPQVIVEYENMEYPHDLQLSVLENNYVQLEEKYLELELRFAELNERIDKDLDEQSGTISSIWDELSTRSGLNELRQLRQDFDAFSKRLRRVVKAEDSISAETLDAAKVPPDVLEITYAKTLNDLYNAMLNIFGDRESSEIVENTRDKVRNFSAGVDFFRFENGVFQVKGLSEATSAKLVSVKQIHATYVELFKLLSQHVPNYSSQDFRSFVETGSREYTVEKVVAHERSIDSMWSKINNAACELSSLTENVRFMVELQNTQLEDISSNSANIEEMGVRIQNISKAVNIHTRALKKLNGAMEPLISGNNLRTDGFTAADAGMSRPEEDLGLKADRSELLLISDSLAAFREELKGSLESIQHQQRSMVSIETVNSLQAELMQLREQVESLKRPGPAEPDIMVPEMAMEGIAAEKAFMEYPAEGYERSILEELASLGPATLKQLEKQLNSRGFATGFDELSFVIENLENTQLLTSFKKGRYTYFCLKKMANI